MKPDSRANRAWLGHLASFGAYAIFGINIIVCKGLTGSDLMSPIAIFLIRSLGAGSIFWLLSLLVPYQKVPLRDLAGIFLASLLGFFLTQITFLTAIPMITPMESSILGSMTPVYTMLIAAVAIHEPITLKKSSGVALSLAGVLYLIITGAQGGAAGVSSPLGLVLMIGNALFFAMYLGMFRPLIERYSVVTFMKWIFLFSALMAMPFGIGEVVSAPYRSFPSSWLWELAYLVVMATFVAYFLIPVGQKLIRPTLVSMYSYIQPIIATGLSIAMGLDALTWQKVLAALAVFGGVAIVSRSRKAR